jgi:mannosyltransferase
VRTPAPPEPSAAPRTARATGISRPPAPRRLDAIVVLAATVAALALRLPNIGRAYWIDEAITIGVSSHPVGDIPALLRHDGSPPLFYVILHFWLEVVGRSPVATHLLPLAFSLACVPAAWWAGREIFGATAGRAAAVLSATNPFLSWYSTETRMYTLVVLLALLGLAETWRALRHRRRLDALGAVAAGAALLYTHAWCLYLVLAVTAVLAADHWRRGDRDTAVGVVAGGAAAFALWLPWLPSFWAQAHNAAAPWAVQPGIGDFFADPSTVLGGTAGVLFVPLLAGGALLTARKVPRRVRRDAALLAGAALLTTIAGFAGAEVEPSWTVRYLAVIAAPYLLAAAGFLSTTRTGRAALWVGCAGLATWSVVGSLLPNPAALYAKDNMAAVAAEAAPHLAPGDLVVVTETEQVPVAFLYLPAEVRYLNPMGPVRDPSVVNWDHIVDRLEQARPCSALAGPLNSLPVGGHVLEIDPDRLVGSSGSAWSVAVNSQVRRVDSFLRTDPGLTPVATFRPDLSPRPFAPVEATLYVKTSAAALCQ